MEVGLSSMRIASFSLSINDAIMIEQLDLLQANYQQKLARGYNRNVNPMKFVMGDLVLRKVMGSIREPSSGKLASNWEGPYQVTAIVGAGLTM